MTDKNNSGKLIIPEFEPNISVLNTPRDMGDWSADAIAQLIKQKPNAVLGLPTGDTPLPMYEALIRLYQSGLDFSKVTFFNLDEYIGLSSDHLQSYHAYMRRNLFDHINANLENIHIPNGMAANIEDECIHYEVLIKRQGGIDLLVIGVGANGHIGFCEPGTLFDSQTHRVLLTEQTRLDNARLFACLEDVPTEAITMGIRTILDAKRIIMLALGASKMAAVSSLIKDPVTPASPVTALRRNENVWVAVDKDAFPLVGRPPLELSRRFHL